MNQEGPHAHPKNMVELTPLGSSLAEGLCMLEQTIGGDVGLMRAYASDNMTGSFEL